MSFNGSLGEINYLELNKEIAQTATAIFVYDTSKDSDGGAWRHRTQNTSWYNETLNTSIRGSRREFPSVAVIVGTSTSVKIYDADDATLPMWMESNVNTSIFHENNVNSIYALNGKICICSNPYDFYVVDMIKDTSDEHSNNSKSIRKDISQRDNLSGTIRVLTDTTKGIQSRWTLATAMTVLPDAPIDPETNLPIPTIAVGTGQNGTTNAGLSIIKHDGNVYRFRFTGNNGGYYYSACDNVFFDENILYFSMDTYGVQRSLLRIDVNNWNSNIDLSGYVVPDNTYAFIQSTNYQNLLSPFRDNWFTKIQKIQKNSIATDAGLVFFYDKDPSTNNPKSNSGVCAITSEYNSGWMHGNIKGAFLADTDATNITGTELITNGTFDTDTSGWSVGNGGTISVDAQRLKIQNSPTQISAFASQGITTESGKEYAVSFTVEDATSSPAWMRVGTSNAGVNLLNQNFNGAGSHIFKFTATSSNTYITLMVSVGIVSRYTIVDNISVRSIDNDRSHNNKPLQVFGSITKSPVASGAELVAYSGFSASNYLKRPYPTDMDAGSGSYSIMLWEKFTTPGSGAGSACALGASDGSEQMIVYLSSNYGVYFDYGGTAAYVYITDGNKRNEVINGKWHFIVCQVSAGEIGEIYVNGVKQGTSNNATASNPLPFDSTYNFYVGCGRGDGSLPFPGSLALVRHSHTKLTADQIKKIYDDEKELFKYDANCTLTGGDTVLDLAHDTKTNLYHVATTTGRCTFSGLRRVDETATSTSLISASNGLIIEQ